MKLLDWDAAGYDRLEEMPHDAWAEQVLDRAGLRGDERVLDAGCGSGRLLSLLRARHRDLELVGVDGSPAMIAQARRNLGDDVTLIEADLLQFEATDPVEAIVSSAVFHWIGDHQRLFERLFAVLRPGGRLEAQCGGDGNVAEVTKSAEALADDERFAPYLRSEIHPWNYASVGDTELRLGRAGFERAHAWLEPWQVQPSDPRAYLKTVVLPWHMERLPEALQAEFVDAVLGSSPQPFEINYVRLNISALRPL